MMINLICKPMNHALLVVIFAVSLVRIGSLQFHFSSTKQPVAIPTLLSRTATIQSGLQSPRIPVRNSFYPRRQLFMQQNTEIPLNIPNILTLGRVCCIPIFIASSVLNQNLVGVAVYVTACLTDFLDGYIARKYNMTSKFGSFLDPVADKLMVASAMTMLTMRIPTWWFVVPVTLIICREISISALREWMAEKGERAAVQVGNIGKWKTALQMISTTLLLYAAPISGDLPVRCTAVSTSLTFLSGILLFYVATALTMLSGWDYFRVAWPKLL